MISPRAAAWIRIDDLRRRSRTSGEKPASFSACALAAASRSAALIGGAVGGAVSLCFGAGWCKLCCGAGMREARGTVAGIDATSAAWCSLRCILPRMAD